MPNLRSFVALDIDPLCYPDDMSILLSQAKKLESLTLHFHPRIRENAEPSVSIDTYFGRCFAAKQPLMLRHLALHNLYAPKTEEFNEVFDEKTLESVTALNCGGTSEDNPMTVFLDDTWRIYPHHNNPRYVKQLRVDFIDKQFLGLLEQLISIERFYMVSARRHPGGGSSGGSNNGDFGSTHPSPVTPGQTPPEACAVASLVTPYLDCLTQRHGHSLKHLLLSHHWTFGADEISQLVRNCPNLTQLGLTLQEDNFSLMRLLIPFLKKLYACRMLMNPADPAFVQKLEVIDTKQHELGMGLDTVGAQFDTIKWVGVGRLNFELGRVILETVIGEDGLEVERKRRLVKYVDYETIKDVAIWKMDSHEVEDYRPRRERS